MNKRILVVLLALLLSLAGAAETLDTGSLESLPVQEGGRLKPLDTVARESVRLITGKGSFQKEPPLFTVLRWWAEPEKALDEAVVEIRDLELKKKLGLGEERWFSHNELSQNAALEELSGIVHEKLKKKEELEPQETKASEVLGKMHALKQITQGQRLAVVPNPSGLKERWATLADLDHPDLLEVVKPAQAASQHLREAVAGGDQSALDAAAQELRESLAQVGPLPDQADMLREVRYNKFHPFRKAWVVYLLGFLLLLFAKAPGKEEGAPAAPLYWAGMSVCLAGFVLHIYGFFLRCMIAGRPPVTNMYESVIWVAFGAVLFSLIFEWLYRARSYLLAASGGAVVCLILADTLPTVLDPTIAPLTPVLRSNFWLTIHVLTITLGYAAFLLALGLGHMILLRSVRSPEKEEGLKSLHQALYKSLQVGVLFLAAGTILGGVWANYSWGRFWGWDPKEVWALIALLGYLAILHGRYAGWLRQFGMAAWSIIAFQGVLMAWYGVNFVLGAGLHSYGFGTGGVRYVAVYVLLECLFVAWASWRHKALRAAP